MTGGPYCYSHPRPAVTVDIVVVRPRSQTTGSSPQLEVLLIRRGHEPFMGTWALPGGYIDPGESPEQAAARELTEETGLQAEALSQTGVFGEPGRDPRGWVISVAFAAMVQPEAIPHAGDDANDARWWPIEALPALAFDHGSIIARALKRVPDGLRPLHKADQTPNAQH